MARCIGGPPRLRALNGIAHSTTHMHLHPTSASGVSVEISYHNLNSRWDGQFGRAGGTKAPVVPVQVPLANPDDLAVGWTWKGLFVIQPYPTLILRKGLVSWPHPLPPGVPLFLFTLTVWGGDSTVRLSVCTQAKAASAEMTVPLVQRVSLCFSRLLCSSWLPRRYRGDPAQRLCCLP